MFTTPLVDEVGRGERGRYHLEERAREEQHPGGSPQPPRGPTPPPRRSSVGGCGHGQRYHGKGAQCGGRELDRRKGSNCCAQNVGRASTFTQEKIVIAICFDVGVSHGQTAASKSLLIKEVHHHHSISECRSTEGRHRHMYTRADRGPRTFQASANCEGL